jgi:uncharacterized cupin superfamily protein
MLIDPAQVPDSQGSLYPEIFKPFVAGRIRKRLGNAAGLKNFGVNLVSLEPGSMSALRHWHTQQDEFIYVLEGEVTLITNAGAQVLQPGMAAGFPAGEANGHHLVNRSDAVVKYLEIGDRTPHDQVSYPDQDLIATEIAGERKFLHYDGTPY